MCLWLQHTNRLKVDVITGYPYYPEWKNKSKNSTLGYRKESFRKLNIVRVPTFIPFNPNGSKDDIAALTNENGNVLAMMPHPERALYYYHVPNWQNKTSKKFGDGYKIFMNAKKFFS